MSKESQPVGAPAEKSARANVLKKSRQTLYRIAVSAVFLSLALVTKMFAGFNIPIFGAGGMKIGFAGIFTAFPAFLFGPLYGGMTSALSDLIGCVIKPDGPYIPWLTVSAFIGGCLKGLIWRFLTRYRAADGNGAGNDTQESGNRKALHPIHVIAGLLFVAVAVTGVSAHVILNHDAVMNGFAAYQDNVPTRGQLAGMELSGVSRAVIHLADYNKDILTVTNAADAEEIVIPETVLIDGNEEKITKIGAAAFSGCTSLRQIYLPASVTAIDDTAFDGLTDVTVLSPEGSKAAEYAKAHGLALRTENRDTEPLTVSSRDFVKAGSSRTFSAEGITVKSSDAFRRYLAGYINFVTVGLETISAAGIILIMLDYIIINRCRQKHKTGRKAGYLTILTAILLSGIVVTTINTEVLRVFLPAWNGRSFIILWIPRVIEEMLVCIFQAYVISILYSVFRDKIAVSGRARELGIRL